MNSASQLSAAQQLASNSASIPNLESSGAGGDDDIPELEAVEEEGPVDETGVDPKDIELVIQQVGCSRAKAVKVLKESGGDLINASAYFLLLLVAHDLKFCFQSWQRASDRIPLSLYFYLFAAFIHPFKSISPGIPNILWSDICVHIRPKIFATLLQYGKPQADRHRRSST